MLDDRPFISKGLSLTSLLAVSCSAMSYFLECLVFSLAIFTHVFAYIPASATNDTNAAIQGGLNVTDVSKLHLQWFSNGCVHQIMTAIINYSYPAACSSYWENVSYQLVGSGSNGFTQVQWSNSRYWNVILIDECN